MTVILASGLIAVLKNDSTHLPPIDSAAMIICDQTTRAEATPLDHGIGDTCAYAGGNNTRYVAVDIPQVIRGR
jgi:hypothetical protein